MFHQTSDQKVALFLADGCEEIEALTVSDLLFRAGIPCTTISVNDTRTVTSSHNITITADTTLAEADPEEFCMLVLPGGIPGTPNLAACPKLMDAVTSFAGRAEEGKAVAAICAAPSILADLGLLSGKKATCNPCVETFLDEHGARLTYCRVTVDGNLITSQGMGTAIAFGLAIVEYLKDHAAAKELAAKILYRP